MKIIKIPSAADAALRCKVVLRVPPKNGADALMRLDRATRRGFNPKECGDRAYFLVDDRPCCRRHAADAALAFMTS